MLAKIYSDNDTVRAKMMGIALSGLAFGVLIGIELHACIL